MTNEAITGHPRVLAIVVARKPVPCRGRVRAQTRLPDGVVVLDNASTNGCATAQSKIRALATGGVDPGKRFRNVARRKSSVFRAGVGFGVVGSVGEPRHGSGLVYPHARTPAALRRRLNRGLRDGLRTRARSMTEVLAEAGYDLLARR